MSKVSGVKESLRDSVERYRGHLRLLYPGMHIKRWIALLLVGLVGVSLGLTYLFVEVYRTQPFPEIVATLTLQFLPRPARGILFILAFGFIILFAFIRLGQSLLESTTTPAPRGNNVVDTIFQYRYLQRGPKIVAIGGGTGLSNLLRGLKEHTSNVTAVVTVADDGGSSGRLRRELGILPPGDFRNCIVALAAAEPLMSRLFQYRFSQGSGLDGHSFGNLFIVAMSGVTGNFEEAIRESSRVLAVRGQILPSTLENLTLWAELEDQAHVKGESQIPQSGQPIKRVYLQPADPPAHPEAVQAIREADIVVVGPGSLYTSVLPNLLVRGIHEALMETNALKVYACNVATQRGETDGFSIADHFLAIHRHLGGNPFHYVLANSQWNVTMPPQWGVSLVKGGVQDIEALGSKLVLAEIVDVDHPVRHEAGVLARLLMRLYYEKTEGISPSRSASGPLRV